MRKTASSLQLPASSKTPVIRALGAKLELLPLKKARARHYLLGLAVACSIGTALVASQASGRLPEIAAPVLFDTPEADRILSALQILPPDNPWHEDVTNRPVHEMSAAIVKSIGADAPLGYNLDMNFVIVPANQPMVNVRITDTPTSPIPARSPFRRTRRSRTGRWRATRTPRRCRVRGSRSSSFSAKAPAIAI